MICELQEELNRAASSPLSLKKQCRNKIRNVFKTRNPRRSIWPDIERLESDLPDNLVDYLMIFPDSNWREERARRVAETINNIPVSCLQALSKFECL